VIVPRGCERLDVGISLAALVECDPAPRAAGFAAVLDFMRLDVPQSQTYLARSFPTHKVMSAAIAPAPDGPLELTLTIDGELRQRSSTKELIASPAELLAAIARCYRLRSGDVILTGSPAGRPADADGPWPRAGSVIEGRIDGVSDVSARLVDEVDPS
jgi:2-keto-4-pentenoate hydratase/2-oxohepta-3-ene-1,7-dioic acid hydratase in catechol pathway